MSVLCDICELFVLSSAKNSGKICRLTKLFLSPSFASVMAAHSLWHQIAQSQSVLYAEDCLAEHFFPHARQFSSGVYISVRKLYLSPPPSRNTSFLDSYHGLFGLILPYFAFILSFYFLFSHFLPLSSLFFSISSFFLHFPLFLFPFSYFFSPNDID